VLEGGDFDEDGLDLLGDEAVDGVIMKC